MDGAVHSRKPTPHWRARRPNVIRLRHAWLLHASALRLHGTVAQIRARSCQCSSSFFTDKRPKPEPGAGCYNLLADSFNEGDHHSWRHMNTCTTLSDERTSSYSGEPGDSSNTAGGSPKLEASPKFICGRSRQWTAAISVTLNSARDHAVVVAFWGAPHYRIRIIFTNIYLECLFLFLNLYDLNLRAQHTNFSVNRTFQ